MNIMLTRERLMEILKDCFYKSGEYVINSPSILHAGQYFAFQPEQIEKYSYEISRMLRSVKHKRVVDVENYTNPRSESELGWSTTLGWLRYTKDDVQWCSINDADLFCALGIATGWIRVTQQKEIFEDDLELLPLHIFLRKPSAKPANGKKKAPWIY